MPQVQGRDLPEPAVVFARSHQRAGRGGGCRTQSTQRLSHERIIPRATSHLETWPVHVPKSPIVRVEHRRQTNRLEVSLRGSVTLTLRVVMHPSQPPKRQVIAPVEMVTAIIKSTHHTPTFFTDKHDEQNCDLTGNDKSKSINTRHREHQDQASPVTSFKTT